MEEKRITVDPYILSDIEGRLRTARAILEMVAIDMENNNLQLHAGEVLETAYQVRELQYKIND